MGVLKALALGREEIMIPINAEKATVRTLIEEISRLNPKLYSRIYDDSRHELQPDIYIAINDVDIRLLGNLDAELRENDEVLMIAYIHGG